MYYLSIYLSNYLSTYRRTYVPTRIHGTNQLSLLTLPPLLLPLPVPNYRLLFLEVTMESKEMEMLLNSLFNLEFQVTNESKSYTGHCTDLRMGLEMSMRVDDDGALPPADSLEQCLSRYLEPAPMTGTEELMVELVVDGEMRKWTEEGVKTDTCILLPPIIQLNPKRIVRIDEKLHHRMSFPEELPGSRLLGYTTCMYKLFSVVVHIGGAQNGHYVTYLNPKCEGQWYLFDDGKPVKRVAFDQVMMDGFGGENEAKHGVDASSTAYMLQYVRESDISDILA